MFTEKFVRENFYFSDDDLLFFNHGSSGICPVPVMEEKFKILRLLEANPNSGFSETMFDGCLESTKILSDRIGVNYDNLAIIKNVTIGMSSVLHSLELAPGEEILLTNFTYEAVRMAVEDLESRHGLVIRTLDLTPPFQSNEEIVRVYQTFVSEHPNIKYAIIDHIPSALPFVQPVKDIVKVLRQMGVFVVVDGAHAAGQVQGLNVEDIDADVFIGNLHKWCFVPRGLGFIAVRPHLRLSVRPPIISFLHNKELYLRFLYMGTDDFSNFLCVKRAFEFIDDIGGFANIHSTITQTLERGVSYLERSWDVTALKFPELAPFMRLVPLPPTFDRHKDAIWKMARIPFQRNYYAQTLKMFKFVAPIVCVNERLHFRISCHVYNNFEQFVKFSDRVLQWLELLENGENVFSGAGGNVL